MECGACLRTLEGHNELVRYVCTTFYCFSLPVQVSVLVNRTGGAQVASYIGRWLEKSPNLVVSSIVVKLLQ